MSMFLTVTKELGKYVYKKINDKDIITKAIEATSEDLNYTTVPVRDILFRWYRSKELDSLVEQFNAGQRELTDNDFEMLVDSFIETTGFYLGQHDRTKKGAQQILSIFGERLWEELLKSKEGLVVFAKRFEFVSQKMIDTSRLDRQELVSLPSSGVFESTSMTGDNRETLNRNMRAEDDQARKILRVEEILRHTHNPEVVKEARQIIDSLIPQLVKGLEKGLIDAAVKSAVVEKLIDQLIKEDKEAIYLLQGRSKLREHRGHWDEAAADLQKLLNSSDDISPSVLMQAGILLMTLGNWTQTSELIQRGLAGETDPVARIRGREILLWIQDYQGRHHIVDRQSAKLLRIARDVDLAAAAAVEHRWGRATFEGALAANHDRELMEIALRRLVSAHDHARRTAGFANPFHAIWIYRVSEALGTRDRATRWEEARQFAEEFGGPGVAHIRLTGAYRAIRDEDWVTAADLLTEAQQIWKRHPYLKGSFDVSYSLGRVYQELGPQHHADAMMNLRLAARIGARLRLPKAAKAKKQLSETVQGSSFSPQYLIRQADERLKEQSFSRLLRGWSFSIPALKKRNVVAP